MEVDNKTWWAQVVIWKWIPRDEEIPYNSKSTTLHGHLYTEQFMLFERYGL